jgi:RNA polymerase sigma-70 factor (ECF subfamily)
VLRRTARLGLPSRDSPIPANAAAAAAWEDLTMESRGSALGPERLLEHAAWARRLARELVADAAAADDVVQEAWLAATRKPPSEDRPLRQWLGRVLRNAARQRSRSERRRAAREHVSARSEALPGPDELVERLDSQRALAEELAKLDEPFRSTVLLRFFEDLEPSEIARRQGLPSGTVRWRLKRGLDELRSRLDARFGGRRRWGLMLVPIARMAVPPAPPVPAPSQASAQSSPMVLSSGATAALTGAMVMNLGLKVAAGAAGLFAVVMGGLWLSGVDPLYVLPWSAEPPVEVAFRPLAAPPASPVEPGIDAREAIATPRSEVAPEPVPAAAQVEPATTMVIRAGAFDSAGAPLAGATLRAVYRLGEPSPPSGPDGALRMELEVDARQGGIEVLIERAGFATQLAHALPQPGGEVYLGNFRLEPGGAISGRVADPAGRGVPGVLITLGEASPSRGDLEQRRYQFYVDQAPRVESQADGSFLLLGAPQGFARVWASGEGWLASASGPVEVRSGLESAGVDIVLDPLVDTMQVRGVVLDPQGKPLPHAGLEYEQREQGNVMRGTRSADQDGGFEWVIHPKARLDLTATDPEGRYGPATARELAGGAVDVELRLTALRQVQLSVRSRAGEPVERFSVELVGEDGRRALDGLHSLEEDVPETELHPGGMAHIALPEQTFELLVRAPGFALHRSGPLEPISIGDELAVPLEPLPGLRGHLLRDGKPLAGVRVELYALAPEMRIERGPFALRYDPDVRDRASTDAEGAFFLTPRERGEYVVRAQHGDFAPCESEPLEIDPARGLEGVELELGASGAIEGRVRVPPGPDAAGTIVGASNGDGRILTQRVGSDGEFRFERLAPGGWQVRQMESETWGTSSTWDGSPPPPIEWDCEVEDGRTTRFDLDLTGAEHALVEGRLLFDGKPSEGWTAMLSEGSSWSGDQSARGGVDPAGSFALESRPGPHYVFLSTTGGTLGDRAVGLAVELVSGTNPVQIDLATGELMVENATAERLVFVTGDRQGLVSVIAIVPDASGRCELGMVPVGAGRIAQMADEADFDSWPTLARVEVKRGEQATVVVP